MHQDYLEEIGHLVLPYHKGQQVIDDVEEGRRYHLALIDLSLPDRDGLEVIAVLKKLHPSVPVICTSAYSLRGESGADRELPKPFTLHQLEQAVN